MRHLIIVNLALLKEISKLFAIVGLIVAVCTGLPVPWWEFALKLIACIFTTWILILVLVALYATYTTLNGD